MTLPSGNSEPSGAAANNWSDAETWAWSQIRAGKIADFSTELGKLEPRSRKGWSEKRTLGAAFLRTILLDREHSGSVPVEGVRIRAARWTEPIDLAHANLVWPLCLQGCRYEAPVDMSGLLLEGRLSLAGSAFVGTGDRSLKLDWASLGRADLKQCFFRSGLGAPGAVVKGVLDLEEAELDGPLDLERVKAYSLVLRHACLKRVTLVSSEFEQDVDFRGATVAGPLVMGDSRIGQDLMLGASKKKPAFFRKSVTLTRACIGGDLVLVGATVDGHFEMNGAEVKKHLFLRLPRQGDEATGRTHFGSDVVLSHSHIHGHIDLMGTAFKGSLNMWGIQIGETLLAGKAGRRRTTFHGPFILTAARVKSDVDLGETDFSAGADLANVDVQGSVSFTGASIKGKLDCASAHIRQYFWMLPASKGMPRCEEVSLQNAAVDGYVVICALFRGRLTLSGLQAGQDVFMRVTGTGETRRFPVFGGPVDLGFARIKGILDLNRAAFRDGLDMTSIEVGGDLRLGARLKGKVIIADGDITGTLSIASSTASELDMSDLHVGQNLHVTGRLAGAVKLRQARIDRVLDMTGAIVETSLDLSAATIGGRLQLQVPPARALPGRGYVQLDLRDAKAASLQIAEPRDLAWPDKGSVQLDGFIFDRLGGAGVLQSEEMMERPVRWFKKWLDLDSPYSPQPYEHLAAILSQAGQTEKANWILYYGRERARNAALRSWAIFRWIGLSLLKWTIGYGIGYGYFLAMVWAAAFTLLGAALIGSAPVSMGDSQLLAGWPQKIAYSFDQLLPIIELNPSFADVKLPPRVEYYFYFHKLLGFLLGTFIAAGVAGLTQRSKG